MKVSHVTLVKGFMKSSLTRVLREEFLVSGYTNSGCLKKTTKKEEYGVALRKKRKAREQDLRKLRDTVNSRD